MENLWTAIAYAAQEQHAVNLRSGAEEIRRMATTIRGHRRLNGGTTRFLKNLGLYDNLMEIAHSVQHDDGPIIYDGNIPASVRAGLELARKEFRKAQAGNPGLYLPKKRRGFAGFGEEM